MIMKAVTLRSPQLQIYSPNARPMGEMFTLYQSLHVISTRVKWRVSEISF